jgi:magnesium chelatase accessory protein
MLANGDLFSLELELPKLQTPLALVVGANDRTISPRQAQQVFALLAPPARVPIVTLDGLGHLAHEERPDLVAALF